VIDGIIQGIVAFNSVEWLGISTGILYVVFLAYRKKVAWLCAFVCACSYSYISFQANLYLETFLQLVYIVLAVLGWLHWTRSETASENPKSWPLLYHVGIFIGGSVASFLLAYLMEITSSQESALLNAFTTVFSLLASYMAIRSILETWLYWILIDLALFALYFSQELYLSGTLYLIYTILAIFAYSKWNSKKTKQL